MQETIAKMAATARKSEGKVIRHKEVPFGISWTGTALKVHPSGKGHGVALNSLLFTEVLSDTKWPEYAKALVNCNPTTEAAAAVSGNGLEAIIHRLGKTFPQLSPDKLIEMAQTIHKAG